MKNTAKFMPSAPGEKLLASQIEVISGFLC